MNEYNRMRHRTYGPRRTRTKLKSGPHSIKRAGNSRKVSSMPHFLAIPPYNWPHAHMQRLGSENMGDGSVGPDT